MGNSWHNCILYVKGVIEMVELNPNYIWGGILITNYSRAELMHHGVQRNRYTTSGPEIGRCSLHHRIRHWHGDTISGDITAVFPTCYITKSVYDALIADGEYDKVASKVTGIVSNDSPMTWVSNPWYGGGNCYVLKKSAIITPSTPGDEPDTDEPYDEPDTGETHTEPPVTPPPVSPPVEEKDIIDQISDILGVSRKVIYAMIIAGIILLLGALS